MRTCSASGPLDHGYSNWTEASAPDGVLRYNPGFNTNSTIAGRHAGRVRAVRAGSSSSATMPANLVVGARYEETDVTSTNSILVPTALLWQDDNDFQVVRPTVADARRRRRRLQQPAAEPRLRHRHHRHAEGALLVQQDHCSRGLRHAGRGPERRVRRVVRRSTASRRAATRTTRASCRSSPTTSTCRWSTTSPTRATCRWVRSRRTSRTSSATRSSSMNLYGIRNQTGGPRAQAALATCMANGFGTNDSALFTVMAMAAKTRARSSTPTASWTGGLANYNGTEAQHVRSRRGTTSCRRPTIRCTRST